MADGAATPGTARAPRQTVVVTEYPPGGGPGRTVATYVNAKQHQITPTQMEALPA